MFYLLDSFQACANDTGFMGDVDILNRRIIINLVDKSLWLYLDTGIVRCCEDRKQGSSSLNYLDWLTNI